MNTESIPPESAEDPGPMLDDEGRAMVGASHHYTAENIRALIADLKAEEAGLEEPAWEHRDHRARAGVLWRVMSGLACDVPPAGSQAPEASVVPSETPAEQGKRIASAWGFWLASPEGRSCEAFDTLQSSQYLKNRLWHAFMAGAEAGKWATAPAAHPRRPDFSAGHAQGEGADAPRVIFKTEQEEAEARYDAKF